MPARRRPVTIDGVEYESILAAAEALGLAKSTLRYRHVPGAKQVQRCYLERPEIRRLRVLYLAKHAKTAKGRATQRRYDTSAKGRARSARQDLKRRAAHRQAVGQPGVEAALSLP